MKASVRRSLPARLVAIGFIILILAGNFWVIQSLIGQPIPGWLSAIFPVATTFTIICGIWMGILGLVKKNDPVNDDEQTAEHQISDGKSSSDL